ncbi:regulator of nonsense transcripts UPF2 [Olea europaea subsp. europaea]|uniref:Regulator of nonsense transcripts UPF2 n=1 Tax=Olea europaea subsp. europaea TaxID=158383 RepID=A0A8S0VN97_OLEEU|nr:regulator of nonsense transcripts UPF2 [Olea europaea subsp. europaea]
MSNMLEILMRLKNVKNLDPRQSTLVENAYYLCKPPERSARVSKVCPPLHQYIRKLIFSDLDESTIEHMLRQLRKLPWTECEPYILKCFLKVHKGKYGQIHLIASLTAGLSRYHDDFAVAVVDEVLEEIRLGLELNDYGMQQQRIAHMRFLGELYNYELVDSSVIFDTLYLILVFSHGTAEDLFAELRPNMIRYLSVEEVNAALIELEEHERRISFEKAHNNKRIDTEKPPRRTPSGALSVNGQILENGAEENGELHEEFAVETDSDSGSGTIEHVDNDNDESDEDNRDEGESDGDYEDEGEPASDENDEVHVRQKWTLRRWLTSIENFVL